MIGLITCFFFAITGLIASMRISLALVPAVPTTTSVGRPNRPSVPVSSVPGKASLAVQVNDSDFCATP